MPVAVPIMTAVATAVVSHVVSKAMGDGQPSGGQAPQASQPTEMPATPDQADMAKAQQRSLAAQLSGRGRASTILTDQTSDSNKLGG